MVFFKEHTAEKQFCIMFFFVNIFIHRHIEQISHDRDFSCCLVIEVDYCMDFIIALEILFVVVQSIVLHFNVFCD